MEKKSNSKLEINDLIDNAVEKAVERRNQSLDSEDALLALSDTEATNVAGGIAFPITTTGIIYQEPEAF
ncbi:MULTISPECIES: hypothetical protein [unclassified Nostoc]|uniref:hypothetical protein n=1 Tax=unclassified Nostoc TaxID=2593658 RepID=UPI002AD288A1|nr:MULTISPECIES: hypothetical protein [unclassified Nostoc]MDZ8126273.1 hypothetical protein [Nostoc sp. CmiVER01]MDZ8227289.1 hypothetical protein [Nostoc sp. ChiVER01]